MIQSLPPSRIFTRTQARLLRKRPSEHCEQLAIALILHLNGILLNPLISSISIGQNRGTISGFLCTLLHCEFTHTSSDHILCRNMQSGYKMSDILCKAVSRSGRKWWNGTGIGRSGWRLLSGAVTALPSYQIPPIAFLDRECSQLGRSRMQLFSDSISLLFTETGYKALSCLVD